MYSAELTERLIKLLAPDGYILREESEAKYPPRQLPENSRVTRVPPSPTGLVHIGTIYAALVNERLAHQSGGVFILRIEDTDKKREVEGSAEMFVKAFNDFGIYYDEGPGKDAPYGPYFQSQRSKIYLGYAVDLLKSGRAYPCFASAAELEAAVGDQQAKKLRPGYYGQWALWRGKSEEEITAALDAGKPFVLRFKSEGSHERRISFKDALKGNMELPENDLDVPLIKSDEFRLPTYHLAHVVDDFLMRTTLALRGDEWLPSTPLHIELAAALSIPIFKYAHLAPISIIPKSGGGKRKLSKRKDPEADVNYWLKAGYPTPGAKAYLLGLANSNFEEWYRGNPSRPLEEYPFSIEKLAASRAPLLDLAKLDDYCKDYISRLPQNEFEAQLLAWAEAEAPYLVGAVNKDKEYAGKIFAVERDGEKARKDLAKWSDAPEQYGYFFDILFKEHFASRITEELGDLDPKTVESACGSFLESYDPSDSQEVWLEKCRTSAESSGMNLRDFARIIRVKLTGKNRTPDLHTIMQTMGESRVKTRLSS